MSFFSNNIIPITVETEDNRIMQIKFNNKLQQRKVLKQTLY